MESIITGISNCSLVVTDKPQDQLMITIINLSMNGNEWNGNHGSLRYTNEQYVLELCVTKHECYVLSPYD